MSGIDRTEQDIEAEDQPSTPRLKPSLKARKHHTSHAVWQRQRAKQSAKPKLPEWHSMAPSERETAWRELCDWVTWLHDRYELDVEERLPRCWAEHPGLIEELRALRAWRIELYQAPETSGQASRYWHAELRQTITAANTFYASGCRAGHTGSTTPAHSDADLQERWKTADHTAGIPPALLTATETTTTRPDSYLYLTGATMTGYLLSGNAVPLGTTVNEFLRHGGSWWTKEKDGWLRIINREFEQRLDQRRDALVLADRSVERVRARNLRPQENDA